MKSKSFSKLKLFTFCFSMFVLTPLCFNNVFFDNQITAKIENINVDVQRTAPDPLNDQKIMRYFTPNFTSSSSAFIDKKAEGNKAFFPALYRKEESNKWISITFKQLFIDPLVARAIAVNVQSESIDFNENSPVLEIDPESSLEKPTIIKNYLYNIDSISLSGLLINSTSNSPEQLLAAVFLNPWIYEENITTISKEEFSFRNLSNIHLENNKLTSLPKSIFSNFFTLSSQTKIEINLDHNLLSVLEMSQFVSSPNTTSITNFIFSIKNNRFTETYNFNEIIQSAFTNIADLKTFSDGNDDNGGFALIDPNNSFFFSDFIKSEFGMNKLWPSKLSELNNRSIIIKIVDDLNLCPFSLNKNNQKLIINANDFSGKFFVQVLPSNEKETIYKENIYFNASMIPIIFDIFLVGTGIIFIINRSIKIKKIKK